MANDDDIKQKELIGTAINAENISDGKNAIYDLDQESLVKVAVYARNSDLAMLAASKILKGNQELLAEVAKNANDLDVAIFASERIRNKNPEILSDIVNNSFHGDVRELARSKLDSSSSSRGKTSIQRSASQVRNSGFGKRGKIEKAKPIQKQSKSMAEKERQEFLDLFIGQASYDFVKAVFDKEDHDNQRAFVEIARSAFDVNVGMSALERIINADNQRGLIDVAMHAYGWTVAEKALENIPSDNQRDLSDIARNADYLGVSIEALGRIKGSNYNWAQDKLADLAKNAYEEVFAVRAFEKINIDNQIMVADIAKNSRFESVALKAVEKIYTSNLNRQVDIAKNALSSSASRRAFEKIEFDGDSVWIDIAKNSRNEYVSKMAVERIKVSNQKGLAGVALNSRHVSVSNIALSKLSKETLDKNPALQKRKAKNSSSEDQYKYNPSYGTNANNTRLDRMMR